MQLEYKEQLADARWLKKRNEILERDNYTCRKCGATSHLNVHHLSYEKSRLAWEYPNEKLITLCEECHAREHGTSKPYIGQVYIFNHSDYTNYMICYGINRIKNEVYLLGVDNGGSLENPVFDCVNINFFSDKYTLLNGFWNNCFTEDNWWQYVLVRILVGIYENKIKTSYTTGFTYNDSSIYSYAKDRIYKVINSNESLNAMFNQILNE